MLRGFAVWFLSMAMLLAGFDALRQGEQQQTIGGPIGNSVPTPEDGTPIPPRGE